METSKNEELASKVKMLLSEALGVEKEDISEEDFFLDDLHMKPAELVDFVESLSGKGFQTGDIELTELETVQELIEALSLREEIK